MGGTRQVLQLHTQSQLFEDKYGVIIGVILYWKEHNMPFKFQDKSMEFNRVGFQMSHGS